jgi:hypothetical protein
MTIAIEADWKSVIFCVVLRTLSQKYSSLAINSNENYGRRSDLKGHLCIMLCYVLCLRSLYADSWALRHGIKATNTDCTCMSP